MSVIAGNPAFPPLDPCRAVRTILPDELPAQLANWRCWATEARAGRHDPYLAALHTYHAADRTRYHWSALRGAAVESPTATGAWANRPQLVAGRDEIFHLPEPVAPRIPVSPDSSAGDPGDHTATLPAARRLAELTRRWDGCVRGNRKLRDDETCYQFTLEEFRHCLGGGWLGEFFAWAECDVTHHFGWCLDP